MPAWMTWLFSFILEWEKVEELVGELITAVLVCVILFALLQCFAGYKIRKIWTAIEGMLLFGTVAAVIANHYDLQTGIIVAIATGAGLVGGLLGYFLWIVGGFFRVLVFLFAVVGAIFASKDLLALGIIIGLAAGLIGGILEIAFNRPFMIGYTAVTGGMITAFCLMKLIPAVTNPWFLPIIISSVLAVLGITAQVLLEKAVAKKSMAADTGEILMPIEEAAVSENRENVLENRESMLDDETKVYTFERSAVEANVAASREDAHSAEAVSKKESALENQVAGTSAADENTSMAEADVPAADENISMAGSDVPAADENISMAGSDVPAADTNDLVADANASIAGQETAQPRKNLCPKCGTEYKPGAKFCMKCGQKLLNL